jgi:nucleotide-binding universal stress UspA family protein
MQTLRKLVVGTDFSPAAQQALELAIGIASALAARIVLVHVFEPGIADLDDQRLGQCEQALCRLVAEQQGRNVDLLGVLRSGKPWQKLDNVAVEVGASLIVIARHGGGRGRRVAIGTVAEQLVRCASRPVLLVASAFDGEDTASSPTNPL